MRSAVARFLPWIGLPLLALPFAQAGPLVVGLVADLPGSNPGEDGVAVASPVAFDLSGHVLDDGEGAWAFPPGSTLQPGTPLWAVADASTWARFDGPGPVVEGLPLTLGNGGDGICLETLDGAVLDCFAYGAGSAAGITEAVASTSVGLVYTRLRDDAGGWVDTDTSDDWRTPRMHRIGESAIAPATFDVGHLTLYASPDSSFDVLTGLIRDARERVHLHVYELRSAALADALVAAKQGRPGLDLQVLVDENPVGLGRDDRHEEADALRRVEEAGGQAWLADADRYDHHHLKVLVADGAVAVQSENWVPSGVPQDASWGNRGWGAVVHDAAVADWFAAWMAGDRAAWDTHPFDLAAFDPAFEPPARLAARTGDHRPVAALDLHGAFRVTPVVAPDHLQDPATDPIAALARSARQRLDVQQLGLALTATNRLGWSSADPLAQAIADAAAAGARTRVMLAQPFSPDDDGNLRAADWLRQRGADARLADDAFATLHNKGVLADGAVALGSVNGNHHSRSENREVSLILEGPGIAAYYAALFEGDWDGRSAGRAWNVPGQDLRALPATPYPTLLAVVGVAFLLRGRR